MKEKIKSVWQKVKDFVEAHWIDILVAIVSAFLGAAIEMWLENRRLKVYRFSKAYDESTSVFTSIEGEISVQNDQIVKHRIGVTVPDKSGQEVTLYVV